MEVGGVVSLKLRGEEKLSIVEISNQILSVVKTDVLMSESFIHIHIHTHTHTHIYIRSYIIFFTAYLFW